MSKTFERLSPFSPRLALMLALSTTGGCVAFAGGGSADDIEDRTDPGADPSEDVSDEDQELRERCRESTEQAKTFLDNNCASCHGGGAAAQGGFDSVLKISTMIDDGKILPGKPESSPLYAAVSTGVMPPQSVSQRPSQEDVAYLRDWIKCGAPALSRAADAPPFIDVDERLATMVADLRNFDPEDRPDIRYIDLYNLSNAGFSEAELDEYRTAVSFLVNSLSKGSEVAAPQRVDDRGLLFRIQLSDYVWSAETWAAIADEYPYAVQYDEDSSQFPIEESDARKIREQTGEPIPYLQGDWFLSHAMRPPLYYDVLEAPGSVAQLASDLGLDSLTGRRDRAGFRNAASSQNDRVIERHELSGGAGSMWLSYDFADGVGKSNVFVHPLDFEPDGIQVAYSLRNGLLGYMIADADGQRLDTASNLILQDPLSRTGAAEAGVSCLGCHQSSGIMARKDQVREATLTGAALNDVREAVEDLYPLEADMQKLFAEDASRYESKRAQAVIGPLADDTMHRINNLHQDTLDMADLAAVLGVKVDELEDAIKNRSARFFPPEVLALRSGGVVPRDGLDTIFAELVESLGLGTSFRRRDLLSGDGDGSSSDGSAGDGSAGDGDGDGASGDGASGDGSDASGDGTGDGDPGYP